VFAVAAAEQDKDITVKREWAQAITARIRAKIFDSDLVADIAEAYDGRVWLELGYPTWGDWCDGELGGFKLPVPQRKALVSELAGRGMSNRSIAEVVGASKSQVNRDISTVPNGTVPERTLGQDGKTRPARREPKPEPPQPDVIDMPTPITLPPQDDLTVPVETPQFVAESKLLDLVESTIETDSLLEEFTTACLVVKGLAERVSERGPWGEPFYVNQINAATEALTDAQIAVGMSIVRAGQ
jgi:hypothetical protein